MTNDDHIVATKEYSITWRYSLVESRNEFGRSRFDPQ